MNRNTRTLRAALVVVATLVSTLVSGRAAGASTAPKWETRMDRATAAALPANQPLLLDFWSATCLPCVEMDRQVFSDERLLAALAKVRPVRIDIDRDPGVARKYNIAGTPTLLLTDSFGRELFRYTGALSVDRMLELLDALPAEVAAINRLSTTLSKNKDDAAALRAMGHELRTAGFYRTSSEYLPAGPAYTGRPPRRRGARRGARRARAQRPGAGALRRRRAVLP